MTTEKEARKNRKSIFVIQSDDIKSHKWAEHGASLGLTLLPQKGSPMYAPVFLMQTILRIQKPKGYIVRYLNDYPSFFKTVARTLVEILLIILCRISKIDVFWICHNVDKESLRNFPKISDWRRNFIARFSKRIFVTDQFLLEKAFKLFPKFSKKIEAISFGTIEGNDFGSGDDLSKDFLLEKKAIAKVSGRKFLSVLVAGKPLANSKSLHFPFLLDLVKKARNLNYELAVIVAGAWPHDKASKRMLEKYKSEPNVLVFGNYTTFSNCFIRENIDFYFRGYDDYSVPFTVYEACSVSKPILALDIGFLPEMVGKYNIGTVTDLQFGNVDDALQGLARCQQSNFDKFLKSHTWSSLATKLAKC